MTNHDARRAQPLALALLLLFSGSLEAQIGGLRRAANRAAERAPDPTALLRGDPPITSNLGDARFAVDSLDRFTPSEAARSMLTLQRTPSGGFVLQSGFYEMHTQSYCLKAGTHAPNPGDHGDGYIYAPTRGPAEDHVLSILRNSVSHPDIPQHEIQVLLWAIIARAKFNEMTPSYQRTAARLLTPQQLATLNRSALDIAGPILERAIAEAPPLVRQVLEAERDIRRQVTNPNSTFADLERVAVLAGLAPRGEGSIDVPSGRWSLHPDGYYIRFQPHGYSYTVTQIWVPQGSPAVGREYDPATVIAMPGNTARQRLVQSGRARGDH